MKKIIGSIVAMGFLASNSFAFADVSISLLGGSVTVPTGGSYVEPGYSAFSTYDGDITQSVSVNGVDTNIIGLHTIVYSVTDSNLDSAFASRDLDVVGGGGPMLWCSGPFAPGWRTDLPGGGCNGKTDKWVPAGTNGCPDWFAMGCVIKQ